MDPVAIPMGRRATHAQTVFRATPATVMDMHSGDRSWASVGQDPTLPPW